MQGWISNKILFFVITVISAITAEAACQVFKVFVLKPTATVEKVQQQEPTKSDIAKDSQGARPDYHIILQRNLFARSANSLADDPLGVGQEAGASNIEELGFVLIGTISGSDNNNRAIIFTNQTQDQELYSTGEVIEGALIQDIQRGKLFFSINGKEEVLDMSEARKMRSAYKTPSLSTAKKSTGPGTLRGGRALSERPPASPPRRRVVRRPRTTQQQ